MLVKMEHHYIQFQVQEAAGGRILNVKTSSNAAGQLIMNSFAFHSCYVVE